MALIADSPADRAEQLILLSERLGALVQAETARIQARAPSADEGARSEKERLANAYRLELARIRDDPALISGAPRALADRLKRATIALQETLGAHEIALNAVKMVAEGLVQAIAEEIAHARAIQNTYGNGGGYAPTIGPAPVAIDRSA